VKVNVPRDTGATAFLIACEEGHCGVATMLAAYGADINSPNRAGATPFYVACQNGHLDIVNLLADLGADMLAPLANGAMPMLVAVERNHGDVIERLEQLNITGLGDRACELMALNGPETADLGRDHGAETYPTVPATASKPSRSALYLSEDAFEVAHSPPASHVDSPSDSESGEADACEREKETPGGSWRVQSWLSGALAAVTPGKAGAAAALHKQSTRQPWGLPWRGHASATMGPQETLDCVL